MKKSLIKVGLSSRIYLIFIFLIIISCQEVKKEPILLRSSSIDQSEIKQEIGKVTDLYFKFYKTLDVEGLEKLLTEDCITMGNDPSEVWNKKTTIQKIKDLKANPNSVAFTNNLSFDLIDRMIQISNNGNAATVTDHSKVSFSKMLIRKTTKLKKVGNDWKISYINTALMT